MRAVFRDRAEACRLLAATFRPPGNLPLIVLGLLRGGVAVGYEIASAFHAPLDILAVRKLGVPWNPDLGFGAIAAGGARVINEAVVAGLGLTTDDVRQVEDRELEELERRQRIYRGTSGKLEVAVRTVVLVDDGVATSVTMQAAVAAVRQQQAAHVLVAVPVAALEAARELDSLLRSH